MTNVKNQRQHIRFEHSAKIQLSSPQETIVTSTKNLSDKGLYIMGRFNNPPQSGDVLEVMVLDVPDAIPRPVVVRHIDDLGFGVEFILGDENTY